jgi:adenylate cyclase
MEKEIAILMADLTGYTAMTDVHGGASAAKLVTKYMEIVNSACAGTAMVTERIGDQVVIVADEPVDLIVTATKIALGTYEEHHFLSIHAGMHFGPVFIQDNTFFGSTINVASRIMNIAAAGQVLCSASFFSRVPASRRSQFRNAGTHRLKNIMDEVELFELLPDTKHTLLDVDPVCHMHVDSSTSLNSSQHEGRTYHFCSERCMELFQANPGRFLTRPTDM